MHEHTINARGSALSTNPLPVAASITKWLLLCAAATFGSIFAYNTLSPVSSLLAFIMAIAVIGLNFAEGYLVRFAVASWRFGFNRLALISCVGALLISAYSIMAGYNVVESYLAKSQQSALATDYDIAAAKQRIGAAKSEALSTFDFGSAQSDFLKKSAIENEKIAALLRDKPANMSGVSPATAATFVAIALEAAIIGLTAFIELFLRPTSLPALVKFNDKLVDWGLNNDELQNLSISASPSAGTVVLPQPGENRPELVRTRSGGDVYVYKKLDEAHFKAWLTLINQEQLKPTVGDAKKYLRAVHQYKMEDAQNQAGEYLERAYNLGYLDLNDKKGAFVSQYILASKNRLEQGV